MSSAKFSHPHIGNTLKCNSHFAKGVTLKNTADREILTMFRPANILHYTVCTHVHIHLPHTQPPTHAHTHTQAHTHTHTHTHTHRAMLTHTHIHTHTHTQSRDLRYIAIWQYINTVIEYRIMILCFIRIEMVIFVSDACLKRLRPIN